MRGGTSRALFFLEEDLPSAGPEREHCLRWALGTQDPRQVDGLGGGQVNTSKVAILSRSSREGVDVEYLAGLAAPGKPEIHYDNNCGNILAAVGPYALERGLTTASPVRIYNRNEGSLIDAHVPLLAQGGPRYQGDYAMAGVPGTGAPIFLDFRQGVPDQPLVTGVPQQFLEGVPVTLLHGASLCMLVRAGDLGIAGTETPEELNGNRDFLARVAELREAAAGPLGRPNTPASPFVVILSGQSPDLTVRVIGLGRCHPALAATVAINLALATSLRDSLAYGPCLQLRLHHPTGIMEVEASPRLGYYRTARLLMRGEIYVPSCSIA